MDMNVNFFIIIVFVPCT